MPSGYAVTILISQTSSLAVGTADSGYMVTILIPLRPSLAVGTADRVCLSVLTDSVRTDRGGLYFFSSM